MNINLKEQFADWLHSSDKYWRVYKRDKNILINKLTEYEKAYRNDFGMLIFDYPNQSLQSISDHIMLHLSDLNESNGELAAMNKVTVGNGSVKAILGQNNYVKFLKELINKNSMSSNREKNDVGALNTILYGPPGTGKTFSTTDRVVKIVEPELYKEKDHEHNKKVYDAVAENQNVLFTTFHQSMSYEDFIEGIKPTMDNDATDSISYKITPGIFKIACARAAYNAYKINKIEPSQNDFEALYEAFIDNARIGIEDDNFVICQTKTGKEVEIYEINSNSSIKARKKGSKSTHIAPLTKENIHKLYDTFTKISQINSLQQVKETVGVGPRLTEFYAVFRSLLEFEETDFESDDEEEVLVHELSNTEIVRNFDEGVYTKSVRENGLNSKPVVLVIDEINRGNVSSIFGELITLIEDDKEWVGIMRLKLLYLILKSRFWSSLQIYFYWAP